MPTRRRAFAVLALLCAAALASLAWALTAGSLALPLDAVWAALHGQGDGLAQEVVRGLRLPRALAAFACGGLLALAGALMQVLLRNPLADPYVLGISGGAAVGALVAMLLGVGAGFGIEAMAFAGALGAMLLVFGLAHGDGSWSQARLLLTGVIVAAGCGAAVALMLSIAPEQQLRGMLFWLMGDASHAPAPWSALWILLLGLLVASLLTAVAVTHVGSVGFVGLIVPHLVRLALGNDQRLLLPAAALAGGILLTTADTLARTIIAPQQLPVGVLTALIGVPVFLFLLARAPRMEGA